ncbi:MAG: PDZ domain-containing protein, partial [Planctomycetes bacterium]|nr:PDZ domain-containing protein [Planctomycetota bacterium]
QARGKARLAVSFDFRARATEVASIEPDAADLTKEKLKKQDLIVKYDGEELIDFEHLTRITRKHDVGDRIPVEVVREGKIVTFEIELVGWKKPEKPETAPAKN